MQVVIETNGANIVEIEGKVYANLIGLYECTPLPKEHGRLIDADKLSDKLESSRDCHDFYKNEYQNGVYTGYDYSLDEVANAPTIVEADKTEGSGEG